MNMSERPPPKRMCPVSNGQSSVRAARTQMASAVPRGQRGSQDGGSGDTGRGSAHEEKGESGAQFRDGQEYA